MRIWSVHPRYLDTKGLVALWREAILAKHVLEGKTKGYKNHPQLIRFKRTNNPVDSIDQYLAVIYEEAKNRGYNFNRDKINWNHQTSMMTVTDEQLKYEKEHLLSKLKLRDQSKYNDLLIQRELLPHPLFEIIDGNIEDWEIRKNTKPLNTMRISIKLLIISVFLYSCAAIGTKTLYRTKDEFRIIKIGFCRLDGANRASRMFYKTDEIFDSTLIQTFVESGLEIPVELQTDMIYETPDLEEISDLCNQNGLDGFILAKIIFINAVYKLNAVPITQNFDTEVELKLFDKNGKFLISTSHNTFHGNSYMVPPPPRLTIHDGTKGAVRRLIAEMNK